MLSSVTINSSQKEIEVTTEREVAKYSGRIVAYTGEFPSHILSREHNLKGVFFAYVRPFQGKFDTSFELARLIRPEQYGITIKLIEANLRLHRIKLRLATQEEVGWIKEAVSTKKAEFEFVPTDEQEKILKE